MSGRQNDDVSSESRTSHSCRCSAPTWWRHGRCSWALVRTPLSSEPWSRKERREPAAEEEVEDDVTRLRWGLWLWVNLETHGDWRSSPLLLVTRVEKFDLGAQLALLHSAHALDPAQQQQHVTLYAKTNTTICTHFHTIAFSLALYLALPFIQITCTSLVFSGVGIFTCKQRRRLLFGKSSTRPQVHNYLFRLIWWNIFLLH